LVGNDGLQGIQGLVGNDGLQGIQGLVGNDGLQGIQGLIGNDGIQGVQGEIGLNSGLTGSQGEIGLTGATGNDGLQGIQGLVGNDGLQGIQGLVGNDGLQGIQGIQGLVGNDGLQGIQGLVGNDGLQGIQGLVGNDGLQGIQGLVGNDGNTSDVLLLNGSRPMSGNLNLGLNAITNVTDITSNNVNANFNITSGGGIWAGGGIGTPSTVIGLSLQSTGDITAVTSISANHANGTTTLTGNGIGLHMNHLLANANDLIDLTYAGINRFKVTSQGFVSANQMTVLANPTGNLQVATKQYVDNLPFLQLTGAGTLVATTVESQQLVLEKDFGDTSAYMYCYIGGFERMRIDIWGNIWNGGGGTSSDIKLKENIVDATGKLADINQLRVVNYNMISKPSGTKEIGFIAQEFEQVFPSVVRELDDRGPDKELLGTKTKAILTSVLIPILVKALQELDLKHETLQTAHNDLLARVSALENN
jgi:hypothetical protein